MSARHALAAFLRSLLAGAVVGLLLAAGGTSSAAASSVPQVISHRGYQGTGCTENTACAFTAAASHGTDMVELDIRFTKTGLPVINHDATVDRTTTGHGEVAAMTQTQFTSLHTDDGGHPATLWAALHAAQQGGVPTLAELKTTPTATQWKNLEAKIPAGYRSRITIQSFISQAVWDARRHGFPMVRLVNTASAASWTWPYDGEAAEHTTLTAGIVTTLHAHGVPVYAWTPDSPADWTRLAGWGVDGLITNADPGAVRSAIGGA